MAEEKESTSIPLSQAENVGVDPEDPAKSPPRPSSPNSSTRKFVDGFFSPLYERLGIDIFGLGFITSLLFVFFVGVFVSSWMGAAVFSVGEWVIKRMPFVRHLYSASKQISAAISPDQNTTAFKEVAIIRHPRVGEYAFGFITSSVVLQDWIGWSDRLDRESTGILVRTKRENEDEELCSVFVPTNHLYIGDIFLVNSKEIIRPNLSIREGIEIIVSGGMTMPQVISPQERFARQKERIPLNRMM
ncbi:hypothetical protein Golax_005364 [Gossypium laxum]|uniref:Uncharacterized protein n=3 Tax=Gossypium TaxID=3633 RepID=A0A7J9A129_9ROSI|nr:hypothetical protein [Gossypium laxum]